MLNFQRIHRIFYLLAIKNRIVSSEELASLTQVTVRTIKNDMKEVALFAEQNGARIRAKRGQGYWIEILDEAAYTNTLFQLKIRTVYVGNSLKFDASQNSINLLQYMIAYDGYFKIEAVSDAFFLPKHVVHEELRKMRSFLHSYDLCMESKANHGTIITGSEFNRRIAMLMLFDIHFHKAEMEHNVTLFYQYFESTSEELQTTRHILLQLLRQFSYQINDDYTQCMARYLILQKKRYQHGHTLDLSKSTIAFLKSFKHHFQIARTIHETLNERFGSPYIEEEVLSLEVLLLIWADIDYTTFMPESYLPVLKEVSAFTEKVFKDIEHRFGISLQDVNDGTAYFTALFLPLVLHLKLDCEQFNIRGAHFIDQQKLEPLSAAIMQIITAAIHETYGKTLSSFLIENTMLQLGHYIKRITYPGKPLNIMICSSNGLECARNLKQQLLALFNPDIFSRIDIFELYEGRGLATDAYDLMILNDMPEFIYFYDWPYLELSSDPAPHHYARLIETITDLRYDFPAMYQHQFHAMKLREITVKPKTSWSSLQKTYPCLKETDEHYDWIIGTTLLVFDPLHKTSSLDIVKLAHPLILHRHEIQQIILYNTPIQKPEGLKLLNDLLHHLIFPDRPSLFEHVDLPLQRDNRP